MIYAQVVDASGQVKAVQLQDDPTDDALGEALGGAGKYVSLAVVKGWEIGAIVEGVETTDDGSKTTLGPSTLIVGAPPLVGTFPKVRKTCDLTAPQVQELAKLVRQGWLFLP